MRMINYFIKDSGLLLLILLGGCSWFGDRKIYTGGPEVVGFRVLPFDLSDVRLIIQ